MGNAAFAVMARRALVALAIAAALGGCKREDLRSFQGMTEGETVRLTAPRSGNLATRSVKAGARVAEGTTLFTVTEPEGADNAREASRRLAELKQARSKEKPDSPASENLRSELAEAEWKLAQNSANAPADGVVVETLYAKGDWVAAGAPVVAILPVDKIKVRFEVPLSVAAHLQHGRSVKLVCEGCEEPVEASIIYISPFALGDGEKDPASLRYMVEARPSSAQAALLKPGVPVTVVL
jgi:multidrug resistance efflux pump